MQPFPGSQLSRQLNRLLVLAAVFSLQACATSPKIDPQIETRVQHHRSTSLSCKITGSTCALPSSLLEKAASRPGHHARIVENGEQALILRLHMIRAAHTSIDLQYFIFSGDTSGRLIMHELLLAANRGVKVRVLFDQLFSIQDIDYLGAMALAHSNLDIRLYNPTFHKVSTNKTEFVTGVACCFFRFNQRMHNKVFQIDRKLSLLGGRNIADRYFDMDTSYNFKDRDVLISGPASADVLASFESYWNNQVVKPVYQLHDINDYLRETQLLDTQTPLVVPRFQKLLTAAADGSYINATFTASFKPVREIEYFWDLPSKESTHRNERTRATNTIFQHIKQTETDIFVQSPYMVLSRKLQKIYKRLKQQNPELRIRYSSNSLASTDAWTAYALYHKKKKRYVQKLGIEIHELMPFPGDIHEFIPRYDELIMEKANGISSQQFMSAAETPTEDRAGPRTGLHSKSIVIDKQLLMIGSHNLDPRSEGYNTENGVFIEDTALALELYASMLRDISGTNSWVVAARNDFTPIASDIGGVFEDISSTLPVFDIWPFSYTTAWQLIPGGSETSPLDPRFYDNYLPVGRFPEVIMTERQILTLAVGSLFGFLGPIM